MDITSIRQRLHGYLEVADDKKITAIYTMVEDEIKDTIINYSPEFKAALDNRVNHYLKGGRMVSNTEMNKRLHDLRKKRK
jgi:hypothetical protein